MSPYDSSADSSAPSSPEPPEPSAHDGMPESVLRDKHVVLLTGYIPPYMLPVYQHVDRCVGRLTILVSTSMEGNREWQSDWGDLDVRLQRGWMRRTRWRHVSGFSEWQETHLPLDTLSQLRRLKPDILVSEELGLRSLLCTLYSCWHRQIPLILICNLSEHSERGRGAWRRPLRRWMLGRCRRVTVNGISGKRYLGGLGVPAEKIGWFPYAAIPGVFEFLPLPAARESIQRLVVCGALTDRKGIRPMMDVVSAWLHQHADRSLSLAFYGSGPLEMEVRQLPPLPNLHLEFHGHCDYAGLRDGFAQGDALIFPTLADEWGLVVNEALAAGLPVLGSCYSQAVEELVIDGSNGWKFRPDHQGEFYAAVDRALNSSPDQLQAMRQNARSSVANRTPDWAARLFLRTISETID